MPIIEQFPVVCGNIDEALEDFDDNKDPILIPQPLPKGHELEMFVTMCEWLYLNVHYRLRSGLITEPGPKEELVLLWMYESLVLLMKIHGVWDNFYLLHEISYGLNDAFDHRPIVKMGMIKREDIMWLQQINKPSPESKRFFAEEICYDRKRSEFSQPFPPGFGENIKFWMYSTRYPFWNNIPQFFSEKHNNFHPIRIFPADIVVQRAWDIICDYENFWLSTQVRVADEFLRKIGLQEISSWHPRQLFIPQLGAQWRDTCEKFLLRL